MRATATIIALINIFTVVNAIMRPSTKLFLVNGEGFIAYLEVPKSFGLVKNCWFKFHTDSKQRIDLNTTTPITTERNELILPFSPHICGIRVSNLNAASAFPWTLEAENMYADYEEGSMEVSILPVQKVNFVTELTRDIGMSTIACSKHDSYTKHCKIIEDNGERWDQCELYTTIRSNRTFDCHMYNWGRMAESHEHITVKVKKPTMVTNATVEETETSIILRCQFDSISLFSCQAELPDHKSEIYISNGLFNGRYSSYDTLTSQSRCAIEIPKPLTPNEIGLWRIINYDTNTPAGCLYYVGKNKKEIIDQELESLEQNKVIHAYDDMDKKLPEIACTMPFVIQDCYIRDPNNTVHYPESIRFEKQRLFGKCSFINLPILAGTWTCGALGHGYDKGILQDIEVIVKPRVGEVLTANLKAKKGRSVELMCKSAFDEPIKHCLFIDPQSRVHLVGSADITKTMGHVQYYGRGLNVGDCGIKIDDLNGDDFGLWKCQFLVISNRNASIFTLELKETVVSNATSVGLGVGISIVLLLIVGVVALSIFYRKRQLSAQHSFTSADPLQDVPGVAGSINLETIQ